MARCLLEIRMYIFDDQLVEQMISVNTMIPHKTATMIPHKTATMIPHKTATSDKEFYDAVGSYEFLFLSLQQRYSHQLLICGNHSI